jgi:hypothetical protein
MLKRVPSPTQPKLQATIVEGQEPTEAEIAAEKARVVAFQNLQKAKQSQKEYSTARRAGYVRPEPLLPFVLKRASPKGSPNESPDATPSVPNLPSWVFDQRK